MRQPAEGAQARREGHAATQSCEVSYSTCSAGEPPRPRRAPPGDGALHESRTRGHGLRRRRALLFGRRPRRRRQRSGGGVFRLGRQQAGGEQGPHAEAQRLRGQAGGQGLAELGRPCNYGPTPRRYRESFSPEASWLAVPSWLAAPRWLAVPSWLAVPTWMAVPSWLADVMVSRATVKCLCTCGCRGRWRFRWDKDARRVGPSERASPGRPRPACTGCTATAPTSCSSQSERLQCRSALQ